MATTNRRASPRSSSSAPEKVQSPAAVTHSTSSGQAAPDYVDRALDYSRRVLAGDIPACKWVKAAARRQLDDLDREANEEAWPYFFDRASANRVCQFIELLRHVKGKWAGECFELHASQIFGLTCVFGWLRKSDGLRRFRTVYEEVPRKNAKTTKLAGVSLYMLAADGEIGAECYSAATKLDQAKIVWQIAQEMARADPEFRARFGVQVQARSIVVPHTAGVFVPLSAQDKSLEGLNVSFAAVDELHAHKTRAVHDVITSGKGARAQPLIWEITTAGSNRAGICYEQRGYLIKILNTTLKMHAGLGYRVEGNSAIDETFWGIIYTLDDGDDPLAEANWPKANPLYGISVNPDDMRDMAAKAALEPGALNNFKTKHLDLWVSADQAWMDMLQWAACADPALTEEAFAGEPCTEGIDAAFKKDMFARIKLFERDGHYYAFGNYDLPEAIVRRTGNEHFAGWAQQKLLREHSDQVIDIEPIRADIIADTTRYQIEHIGFDPFQLTQFATEMLTAGHPMVEVRPIMKNFSEAMKELEVLVMQRRFHHNGDPILEWAVGNVVCHYDEKENIYPRKQNKADATKKIDPLIALLIALKLKMMHASTESIYEQRARNGDAQLIRTT